MLARHPRRAQDNARAVHAQPEFRHYDDYSDTNKKRDIFRNYKWNRKPVKAGKGKITEDFEIRESQLPSKITEFFYPDDDVYIVNNKNPNPIPPSDPYFQHHRDLSEQIRQNLAKMGYEQVTHLQRIVIPLIAEERNLNKPRQDLVICGRTGSGKTLAYVVPLVNNRDKANWRLSKNENHGRHTPGVLIMARTSQAAKQIHRLVEQVAFKTSVRVGTAIGAYNRTDELERNKMDVGVDILIATTGRLVDYLQEYPNELSGLDTLVFDDADQFISDEDWCEAFKVILKRGVSARIVCFAAGFDERNFDALYEYVHPEEAMFIDIASIGKIEGKISQRFVDISEKDPSTEIMKLLLGRSQNGRYPKAIIYCNSKETATMLSNRLQFDHTLPQDFRPKVTFFHGGTNEPTSVMEAFRREKGKRTDNTGDDQPELDVIVACDGLSYGIDTIAEILINFNFPHSFCSYASRLGRLHRGYEERTKAFTFINGSGIKKLPERDRRNILNIFAAADYGNATFDPSLYYHLNLQKQRLDYM